MGAQRPGAPALSVPVRRVLFAVSCSPCSLRAAGAGHAPLFDPPELLFRPLHTSMKGGPPGGPFCIWEPLNSVGCRALLCGGRGRGFESRQARHNLASLPIGTRQSFRLPHGPSIGWSSPFCGQDARTQQETLSRRERVLRTFGVAGRHP